MKVTITLNVSIYSDPMNFPIRRKPTKPQIKEYLRNAILSYGGGLAPEDNLNMSNIIIRKIEEK